MNIEQILDSYGDRLYNYLSIILGSPLDAEDVLQEVCYRLLKYKVKFRLINNPSAYLFRMARNEAVNYLKQKKAHQTNPYSVEEISQVIQNSITGPDLKVLNQASEALSKIPEDQREVFVLKFFGELTFKEIARVCGVSIGTITSRYRYGMQKLSTLLEDYDERFK
jgi:RNA polymerase sigma-70 factor (ECF subfamily)